MYNPKVKLIEFPKGIDLFFAQNFSITSIALEYVHSYLAE
jgi:hypothetical protein